MLLALAMCSVAVFPRYGTYVPTPQLHGPGLLLDGAGASTSPDNTLTWLHARLVGDTPARGGNVVILRASYANIDDRHFYRAGNFASVQTVLIPPCATAKQVDAVVPVVDTADAVYFAGGDQANYVRWKGSALIDAVKRVYARGGVVGGGSAGLAIQGEVIYDSVAADALNVETTTFDAVKDPLEPRISFTTGLFDWPALQGTITDSHFVARDRFGRTVAFLASLLRDRRFPACVIFALGIDEGSAVVVDPDGMATVFNAPGAHGAYLLYNGDGQPCVPAARLMAGGGSPLLLVRGNPLMYLVGVAHIARDGERFDLLHKSTAEPWYYVYVDGSRSPVYNRDPYNP